MHPCPVDNQIITVDVVDVVSEAIFKVIVAITGEVFKMVVVTEVVLEVAIEVVIEALEVVIVEVTKVVLVEAEAEDLFVVIIAMATITLPVIVEHRRETRRGITNFPWSWYWCP